MLNGPDRPVQGSDDLTGMSSLLFSEKGQDAPAVPQDDALAQDAGDLTGMSDLIFGEAGPEQEQPADPSVPLALPPALEQELQLRNLHAAFAGVSPDKLGQAADLAAKAGVPLGVALQDPEKFRKAMDGNPDWQALLSEAPATVDFLRDGPNMGVAGDSIPQLGEVERLQAALAGYAGRRPEPLPGMADVLSGWAKTGDSPGVFRGFLGGVTETLKGIARGNNILAANFAERRMRGVEADLRAVGYADSDIRAYLDDGRPLPEMPNEAALPWYWRLSNSRPEQEGTRTPDQAAWLNSAPLMRAWYGLWRNVSESNRNGWLSAANKDSRWGKLFRADQDFAANLQRYGGLPRLSFDLGNGVASMANTMAWALLGSPMVGVGAMYAQIAGGDLERGEAEGLDADKNWRWANWNALLQSPMEALSLGKALAVWKPGKVLGQRFKALVESMLTEGTTEYAQSYVEELADVYKHSDRESLAEFHTFLSRLATYRFQSDALYQGAVGALSSALVGGPRVATAMWTRNPHGQDQITNLAQAVEQVQALKRSAVVAEAFTAQLVEKGRLPGKVFVPAQALQTYFQADPTSARLEGFLATAGLDMNAYVAALGTGADLEIEGRKLGPVFQTEAGKALRDAFTMNPVEREAAEMVGQIVQEVDAGGSIEQAAASAAERMQAEELFKAPIAEPSQYREQVVRGMVGAGLAENRARKVADLIDANARIWATIPGESVQSYYERYGFRFRKTAFGRIMQQMFLDHGAGLGVSTFEQMVARYNTSPRFREKVHRMVPRYLEAEVQAEAPVLDLAGVESVVREAARALNLDPAAAWTQVQGLVGGLDVTSIVDAVRGVAGDALAGEVQKVFTGRDQAAEKRRVLDIERWAREQAAVQRDASLEAYNAVVGRIRELGGLNSQDIMAIHGRGALETLQSNLGRDIVSQTGKHPDALAGEFQELAGHLGTFADNGLADGQALVEWLLNSGNKKAIQERYRRDVEALKAEAESMDLAAQERLPLTDALRAAVLAGQPLYQGKQAPIGPRGATQFAQDGQAMIHFFEARNLSTAPHEVYHVFRRVLEDMALHPNAPQWVKDDWSQACGFVGAEVGQRWTPEQEEKWARAGEAYLREGHAPAPGLRGVFTTFRRWMRTIYDTVLQLGVHLSPDMRGVFDRLLATDEEIAQARERVDARPMLDLEQAAAEYVEAARKAQVVADEAIEKRRLEEHARRLPAWTKQAREDVDKHPGQRLLADIVKGNGLNLEGLLNEIPLDDKTLSQLRTLRPGTNLVHEAGTVDARDLAYAHGYETVGEMVAELLDTPTKSELLKARVSELEEQFNAEWDPEVAILSDEYERLAEMEAEVLAENAKGRPARASEIKRIVRERTGQMRTEYIQVSEIEALKSVIRREAAAARTAYRAGKNDMALAAKERQRRAIAELRERFKAKQEVARIIAAAKRAAKSKSISWDFHEQVLELVRKFDLGTDTMAPRRPDERPPLSDFLVAHTDLFGPAGAAPDLAVWIIAADGQDVNYRELTLDQLRDVAEAINVLSHQGRDYDKLIAGQEKAALRDVADQSVATMAGLGTKRPFTDRERKTTLGQGRSFVRRFAAELGMVEFWLKAADGFKKGSEAMAAPLYRHLVQPVVDSRAAELARWEEVGRQLDEALAPMKQWARDRIFIPDVLLPRDVAAAWEGSWTREKVFMLALNMGNAGNRKALRRGYGQVVNGEFMEFSDEAMDRVVSHLTDADWDMVEKVWSLVDTIFPEVEAAYFKLNGKKLRKVEAEPFYTPDGRLVRGGYFPLIFDRQFSRQAGRQIEADEIMNSREAVLQKPNPSSGMTKERKGGTLPPRLSLSVLHKHLYDSIHYATHAVAMRDAARLVMDERWADAFTQHFGADAYEQLLPWLRYIARPERERWDAFEDLFNRLRNKATVATLGLNPQVAIKQVTSVTGTMKEVGVLRTLKAMGQMIGSGDMSRAEALDFVDSHSPFMRNRAEQIDREMKQVLDRYDVDRKSIKVGDHELTWNEFHEFCFWGIRAMDAVATYPSWMAAYNKAMEDVARAGVVDQAAAEAQAARYADDVVRQTQPSSNPMDLAHFQRSSQGIKRVFSMFLTFTLKFANRQAYHIRGLREGKIGAGEYAKHFWLEWMVPPIAVEVILAALKSGDLPEWKEDPKSLPLALAGYWLSGIPVVRNIAGAIQYGRGITDSLALQGGDSLYEFGRGSVALMQEVWTGRANTDDYLRWLRHLSEAASFAYGVPIKWAPIAWEGMRDWIDGKTSNPARLLFRDPNEKKR